MKLKTYTVRTTRADARVWQKNKANHHSVLERCPIQRWFERRGFLNVGIGGAYIGIAGNDYELPQRVKYWLARLDSGKPVRPITFKIKLPV